MPAHAELRSPSGPSAPTGTAGMWMVLLLTLGSFAGATLWGASHLDEPAPDFHLTSTGLEHGVQGPPVAFSLADYRGQTLVLDLMAVQCDACAYVTQDVLKPLWAEHQADVAWRHNATDVPRLAFLSVDTWADPRLGGETADDLRALQRRDGTPWRHALDTDLVYQKYSAVTLPRVVVVSADGRIVYDRVGVPSHDSVAEAVSASLAGQAASVPMLRLGFTGLAFVAGAASVLSPCSFGMVPAYLGMLLQDAGQAPPARRLRRSVAGGLAAAFGIVVVYAGLAVLFAVLGPSLGRVVPWFGPVAAAALVVAGALALVGRAVPGFGRVARAGSGVDGRRGFTAFGVAFGLCGFGCTGPVFLPVMLAGFSQSVGLGVVLFLAYAGAVAVLMALLAALVGQGATTRLQALLRWTPVVQRAAGAVLVGAGLYLLAYYALAPGRL